MTKKRTCIAGLSGRNLSPSSPVNNILGRINIHWLLLAHTIPGENKSWMNEAPSPTDSENYHYSGATFLSLQSIITPLSGCLRHYSFPKTSAKLSKHCLKLLKSSHLVQPSWKVSQTYIQPKKNLVIDFAINSDLTWRPEYTPALLVWQWSSTTSTIVAEVTETVPGTSYDSCYDCPKLVSSDTEEIFVPYCHPNTEII